MFYNNSFYKSNDLLNNNKKYKMYTCFNPYEYNLESNLKDKVNTDINNMKSLCHEERNKLKNK